MLLRTIRFRLPHPMVLDLTIETMDESIIEMVEMESTGRTLEMIDRTLEMRGRGLKTERGKETEKKIEKERRTGMDQGKILKKEGL